MPYVIELLLPVPRERPSLVSVGTVRDELAAKFGGVTLYVNSPAEGLWEDDGEVEHDVIVVAEVMTESLDRTWWAAYRKQLEARFDQEEIVIRATQVQRLRTHVPR